MQASRHKKRYTGRQTDRRTDRQADRQRDRQAGRQVVRPTDMEKGNAACLLLHTVAEQSEVGRKGGVLMGAVEVDDVGAVSAQQVLVSDLTCRSIGQHSFILDFTWQI